MFDTLSDRIVSYIMKTHKKEMTIERCRVDGIYDDICELRRLKEELVKKDQIIRKKKMEWDKTFDSIIDNIVIINSDRNICKANRSFIECSRANGFHDEIVGHGWSHFRDSIGIGDAACIVEDSFVTGEPMEDTINIGDRSYHVLTNPIKENGTVISVVRISRDITSMVDEQNKIERQNTILNGIAEMSQLFNDDCDVDVSVGKVIAVLGETLSIPRVYVYMNDINTEVNRLCAVLFREWRNDDSCTEPMTVCINYENIPLWEDGLSSGEIVHGHVPDCTICDKATLCGCDHMVINAVPIFSGKKWWGFIGFDYQNDSIFKDDDEVILRVAADTLGNLINNKKALEECHNKNVEA